MTLLELMLALALTGLVMVVLSMAIDLNLRTFDSRRADVERAQLAQAVLRHIAADLQNAVIYEPLDMSGVPQMAAGTDLSGLAADAGLESGLEGDMTDLLGDADLGLDSTMTANNTDIAGTVAPTSSPGLFGNQFEMQVDVSHLPRVDQYQQVFLASAEGAPVDIPSDVKTVAYYLQMDSLAATATTAADVSADSTSGLAGSGLVRRSMDRAATSWAAQSGGLDTQANYGQMLAPEINYLEFRYFDGTQWLTEWDSDELGGLPVAVEITIGIDPAYGLDEASTDVSELREASMADMTEYLYRLVVRLPTARPLPLDEESLETGSLEAVGL